MRVLYALYSDPDSAQQAFDSLRANGATPGFDERQIAVVSSEPFDGFDFFRQDHKTIIPWIAALGGLVGGVAGFWFAAYTQAVYPIPTGGMPIVPFYADGIITYEMTMLGAILATLITVLITARLPNWKRKLYDPEVSDGKILVGVIDAPEAYRAELEKKLLGAGASGVKEFSSKSG
ncbi:MAG TPA: quinol:electron acceptor oxidoreductase subunit ActD [Terriglobia bacterium]|nr:quinol:electron acceptor oxidoreductase subunit ActD [Terriglobia bacterium]